MATTRQDAVDRGYRKVRDIGEVQAYLEQFVPNISPSLAIRAMLVSPASMLLNVCFICYGIYDIRQQDTSDFSDRTLYFGQHFIAYLELVGLLLLLAMAAFSLLYYRRVSMAIDVLALCGSWSSFKLFYQFRPQQLLVYCSTYYTQNAKRLQATQIEKTDKMREIKAELDAEIAYLGSLKNKVNTAAMQGMSARMTSMIQDNERERAKQEKKRDDRKETILMLKAGNYGMRDQLERMQTVGAWLVIVTLCLSLCVFGVVSLLMKISQLAFVGGREAVEWTAADWFTMAAFCNQLWGMVNADDAALETLYQFVFMDSSCKLTRYISHRCLILDDVIKTALCRNYGVRGALLALSFDATLLKKIII